MSKPSWLYDYFYCEFMYKLPNSSMYANHYVKIVAANKRHARKVLFKLIDKKLKKTMTHIRITNYEFLPMSKAEQYDYSCKYFWSEQDYISGN